MWACSAAILVASLGSPLRAAVFENNFNSDPSGVITILDPARWVSSGGVGGSGYISLTDAVNDQQGSIIIDDFSDGMAVGGFVATFKLRMGGGSGNAADGFSFNFANDLTGGTFGEEGQGSGLTIAFDIYDNGGGEAPAIDVKVGGAVVRTAPFAKADILTGGDFVDVRIEYRNGLLDVDFKGQPVYQDVAIPLPPIEGGSFGFGARTGGENNNHWIDDLRIETFAQTEPTVSAVRAMANGVSIQLRDAPGAAVDASSVTATFDGTAAAGTATKSGEFTSFTYAGTTLFEPGSEHTVVLNYRYGSGTETSQSITISTPDYTLIPADTAIPADAINTSNRGFTWRIHQVDAEATLPNTYARALDQLNGQLGDNVADPDAVGGADAAASPANPASAPIEFNVSGVINFSQIEGEENGNATPDIQMPGVPGLLGLDDNLAAAVITAIEFPAAGTYTLIVNSDDGFVTTTGRNPSDVFAERLGFFEGGRGAADTVFHIHVETPGIYPFQTIWYEGDGGANIEWLSVAADESRVLLNDPNDPSALKTYRIPAAALPAYISSVSPAPGSTPLLQANSVEVRLVDAGTQVNTAGITLRLNGTEVPVTVNKAGSVTTVSYTGGLNSGADYTAELTYSDGTARTVSWTFNSGMVAAPVFVIEAEDFDYDAGLFNPQEGIEGMDVNVMPYLGGAYDGLGAIEGIDFNNDDGNDSDIYRTELDENGENEVNIAARNNIAGGNGLGGNPSIHSNDRVTYTVTSNYGIGWVGGGNWQNYTRTFPTSNTAGWWKVFAALSYDGTADGQLSGSLDLVTEGVGTTEQVTQPLGQFSAPGSGGWGNNNLVPMRTASGDPAVVKLVGTQTVRFNTVSGDFDFLLFSPASPPPPAVESVPQDSATRTNVVLDWVLRDTDSKVNPASVRVEFAGEDVTAQSITTKTDTGATVRLDLSATTFAAGEYPWTLSFSDDSTPPQSVTASGMFVVVPYPGEGIFTIEAEDFNYSEDGVTGGLTNPQAGVEGMDVNVMPYLGGAYADLSAVKGVDYNNADGLESDQYRTELDENGENEVNIAASNGNRYSNDRGSFEVVNNYRIGWVAPGEWQNYTRNIPQGSYNIWAALSYDGRSPGQLNGSLDLVTSDPTQPNQTVQPLGTFNAPGSGGWGRNELVPMKTDSGSIATVQLGGVQTLRFNLGSGDFDYIILVPTESTPEGPRITSVTRVADGSIRVEWTGGGSLETAESITGPWNALTGSSPQTLPTTGSQLFIRVRQ